VPHLPVGQRDKRMAGVIEHLDVVERVEVERPGRPLHPEFNVIPDLNDVGILQRVGLACTVPGAATEVTRICDYITSVPGGAGAVRDVVDLILAVKREERS